jgi:hypothetical protein
VTPRTETELLDQIVDLAKLCGWLVSHQRPARTADGKWRTAIKGHPGFPDLVLAHPGILLIRELKGPRERLSPGQRWWAQYLAPGWQELPDVDPLVRAGWRFDVWRPRDFEPLIVPLLRTRARVVA